MTEVNKKYKNKQKLSEEQKQELLNIRIEQSKNFGNSHCIGRRKEADGVSQCVYTGNESCGRQPIYWGDHRDKIKCCVPNPRDYTNQ
jgi:hypothetical protein